MITTNPKLKMKVYLSRREYLLLNKDIIKKINATLIK